MWGGSGRQWKPRQTRILRRHERAPLGIGSCPCKIHITTLHLLSAALLVGHFVASLWSGNLWEKKHPCFGPIVLETCPWSRPFVQQSEFIFESLCGLCWRRRSCGHNKWRVLIKENQFPSLSASSQISVSMLDKIRYVFVFFCLLLNLIMCVVRDACWSVSFPFVVLSFFYFFI